VHGGHVQDTRFPLTHFAEHVACSEVGKVGRIGPWAKNEVCSSRCALQL